MDRGGGGAAPIGDGSNRGGGDGRSSGSGSGSGGDSFSSNQQRRRRRRSSSLAAAALAAVLSLLLLPARAVDARAVDISFEGRPVQLQMPWAVSYTWANPTKSTWPSALTYTAAETGTSYVTVVTARVGRVTQGQLQGAMYVQRASGELSGGSDRPLVVAQPSVELWQSTGAAGSPAARVASSPCAFDGGGTTFTLATPGSNARCTFTFNPPFGYDPEMPAELRVPRITFSGGAAGVPAAVPAATGFTPYPLEPYGPTGAAGRCAMVTDTHTFAAVGGKPSPFATGVVYNAIGNAQGKPPAAPSLGTEVCASTTFKYTAVFPSTACSATAWPVTTTVVVTPKEGGAALKVVAGMTVVASCTPVGSPPFPPPPAPPPPPPPPPPPDRKAHV